jgi:hypothetical protein
VLAVVRPEATTAQAITAGQPEAEAPAARVVLAVQAVQVDLVVQAGPVVLEVPAVGQATLPIPVLR